VVTFLTLLLCILGLLSGAALVVGVLLALWFFTKLWSIPSPDPSPATKESAAHGRPTR